MKINHRHAAHVTRKPAETVKDRPHANTRRHAAGPSAPNHYVDSFEEPNTARNHHHAVDGKFGGKRGQSGRPVHDSRSSVTIGK